MERLVSSDNLEDEDDKNKNMQTDEDYITSHSIYETGVKKHILKNTDIMNFEEEIKMPAFP